MNRRTPLPSPFITPNPFMNDLRLCLALSVAGFLFPAHGQTFQPNWESLDARPTPSWFEEAKFGIFIHWGVYSVPSWGQKGTYAEWYWHDMHDTNKATWKFHTRTYGADFKYPDFANQFHAELFNPAEW